MKKLEINSISSMGGTPVHGCGAADSGLYGETCSAGPGVQRGKDGVYVREVCDILDSGLPDSDWRLYHRRTRLGGGEG